MSEALVVPARYCGPPSSGNGGYVAGSLAQRLGGTPHGGEHGGPQGGPQGGPHGHPITVSLRRPPPLETPMEVVASEGGLVLQDGDRVVATAATGAGAVEPVAVVSWADAVAASPAYPGHASHPFPTCFTCGVERSDGLRIFPGPVTTGRGGARVAAPWTPDESNAADFHEYDGPARRVSLAATWAALDCSGGWAAGNLAEHPMVLARMTAVVDALPVVGAPHVVMGEMRGQEGRKTMTASTLVDVDGRIVGRAEHLWVAVDLASFGA